MMPLDERAYETLGRLLGEWGFKNVIEGTAGLARVHALELRQADQNRIASDWAKLAEHLERAEKFAMMHSLIRPRV